MNWQLNNRVLVFLCAITLFCCKNRDVLPYDVDPNNTLILNIDSSAVVNSVLADITTQSPSYAMSGKYLDDVFGLVECNAFFQVDLSISDRTLTTNLVIDSVMMTVINVANSSYGVVRDSTVSQTYDVFTITDQLNIDTLYRNTSNPAISTNKIASFNSKSFKFKNGKIISDTVIFKITDVTNFSNILLNPSLNRQSVLSNLKGICIKPASGTNEVSRFEYVSNNGMFKIYYHSTVDTSIKDVIKLDVFSDSPRFNRIVLQKKPALSSLINYYDTIPASNLLYMQSGTGIMAKIRFPKLDQFINAEKSILVNKAIIEIIPNTNDTNKYYLAENLIALELDSNSRLIKNGSSIVALNDNFIPAIGSYNSNTNNYEINLTEYFNKVLAKKKPNSGIFITINDIKSRVNRLVIDKNNVRLKLFVTPSK